MLPTTSWPSSWKARSENGDPGSRRGRVTVNTSARTMTTTMSEVITKARVNVASGPFAPVCDRTPSVAEGLRVMPTTPQRRATPTTTVGESRREGQQGTEREEDPGHEDQDEDVLHQHCPQEGSGRGHELRHPQARRRRRAR